MRIDELDPKHKKFKTVILDHELTKEQLDEVLPAVLGVGRAALSGIGMVGRAGAGIARGVGSAVRGVGQAIGSVGRAVGGTAKQVGNVSKKTGTNNLTQKAKDQLNKKVQSFAQDTAKKLANQNTTTGTSGSTGTIGTDQQSTGQQPDIKRGQELSVPQPDPKNPKKTMQTPMKVKNVSGREVELTPTKKVAGQPNTVKYNKKDLAF